MAYAALISLTHTIHRLDKSITKSAYDELKEDTLIYMLMGSDIRRSRGTDTERSVLDELDAEIRDAVWKLEDVLESYQLSQGVVDEKGVQQEIDSFFKTAEKLREEYERVFETPLPVEEEYITDDAAIHDYNSITVGLSVLAAQIRTQLLRGKFGLEMVSILGMAGIGKTHLARQIYHHPLIVQNFRSRAWVSLGPKVNKINTFLVDILAQLEHKSRDLFKEKDAYTLRDLLHNSLRGRRYFIVLDDIWCAEVLEEFLKFFPNGYWSRILITTRLRRVAEQEVAQYERTQIHEMPFLNNEESWDLLWQNVFIDESNFPSQLEKAGRKIAEHCEGLPLLILVVADILRGLDKTQDFWKKVAEKKTTIFPDAYEQIYKVLLPSYDFLDIYLKPCFLYMGVFPQSNEILISKLFNLWVVEDFLKPSRHQTVEDFAMVCLEGLVDNSLAIVCKRNFERVRRIKSSKLHSVYWYLCVKEARKNKFFHVLNKLTDVTSTERPRRLSVQNNILFGIKGVYDSMAAATSTTRSLLFTGEDHQYPTRICFDIMLMMKVLDALAIRFYEFPYEVLKLLQLRYLALTHNGELPRSISKLQQLECLILRRHHNIKLFQRDSTSCLPWEIWDLLELRHLRIMGSKLPDPSKGTKLRKLLRLYVNANSCTEHVLRSVPNLKKIGIEIELEPEGGAETVRCLEHIGVLEGLESLKCVVVNPFKLVVAPPEHLSNLPRFLKKLSLDGLGYPWKYMSAIGSLPCLEVLKLRCSAFQGPDWKVEAGQFRSLLFLRLEDIDVVHWTVEETTLPYLRRLIVRHCYKLKKLPCEFVGLEFLGEMEIDECSPSVVASAHQIKEEISYLSLVIISSWNL